MVPVYWKRPLIIWKLLNQFLYIVFIQTMSDGCLANIHISKQYIFINFIVKQNTCSYVGKHKNMSNNPALVDVSHSSPPFCFSLMFLYISSTIYDDASYVVLYRRQLFSFIKFYWAKCNSFVIMWYILLNLSVCLIGEIYSVSWIKKKKNSKVALQ